VEQQAHSFLQLKSEYEKREELLRLEIEKVRAEGNLIKE
jgi:hypothetical protein